MIAELRLRLLSGDFILAASMDTCLFYRGAWAFLWMVVCMVGRDEVSGVTDEGGLETHALYI